MSRLSSTSAYYKASTTTQIQYKTVQVHKNKTLNRQNNNDMAGKSQYKRGTWTKTLSP